MAKKKEGYRFSLYCSKEKTIDRVVEAYIKSLDYAQVEIKKLIYDYAVSKGFGTANLEESFVTTEPQITTKETNSNNITTINENSSESNKKETIQPQVTTIVTKSEEVTTKVENSNETLLIETNSIESTPKKFGSKAKKQVENKSNKNKKFNSAKAFMS